MSTDGQNAALHVSSLEIDGHQYNVAIGVEFDGVEHVGHLWFSDDDWEDEGCRDHGAIPGESPEQVLLHARALSAHNLALRFQRAQAEQRRFLGLRKITEEVLRNIRYLNTVATSMRAGLLGVEEAASEIDSTEKKLHEMISQLRVYAGVMNS